MSCAKVQDGRLFFSNFVALNQMIIKKYRLDVSRYSMEMAGIVCYTGSTIITRARELIECIGRPLELDTDGIWCILPATFPENFVITTTDPKKKLVISYPCAMLNLLIKDFYTNDQYHELVDKKMLKYDIRSENSVFFEVDGPYHAMVLPASKEEGKKLKKRYAVFNFDGTLAELKGFEVKRNGELQLIKIFQSSVFEAFLKGNTLEECYDSVAKIANYWLDILYSKAENISDNELFDLIAERRTMSKALEEYGDQKSTSISTAKRLAEFLGDEMVKDKGLNCKYVISKKPEGTTVTERAIPIAIFQAEPSVCKHYLKKWLKAQNQSELEIRNFLDWDYYVERLNGCIQKIITIPAALQGVLNPVPRVVHPDWLHKRLAERNSTLRQRKINELFTSAPRTGLGFTSQNTNLPDIEEIATNKSQKDKPIVIAINSKTSTKRKHTESVPERQVLVKWRDIIGQPPASLGKTKSEMMRWLAFHKNKWSIQIEARMLRKQNKKNSINNDQKNPTTTNITSASHNLTTFIQKSMHSRFEKPWEIICVNETSQPGILKMWTLVDTDLYPVNVEVPRNFYVNQIKPLETESSLCRRSTKHLPRSQSSFNLYHYSIPEKIFQKHQNEIMSEFSNPNVEGIYEMNVPLMFRVLINLGCQCGPKKETKKTDFDSYALRELEIKNETTYLSNTSALKVLYIFAHFSMSKLMVGFFVPASACAHVFVLDSVRANNMPNLSNMFNAEHEKRVKIGVGSELLPTTNYKFEIKIETNEVKVYKALDRALSAYKDEKRGATYIALQSNIDETELRKSVPVLDDFPIVRLNIKEK
jgi:DNA polymerase epsilon subunit 1